MKVTVHYHRPDGAYEGWGLWVWEHPTGTNSRAVPPSRFDEFGAVFSIDCGDAPEVGMLPSHTPSSHYDRPDRLWQPSRGAEIWIKCGDAAVHQRRPSILPRLVRAFVDGPTTITAVVEHALAPAATIVPGLFRLVDADGVEVPLIAAVADERCLTLSAGRPLPRREREAAAWRLEFAGESAACLLVRTILDGFGAEDELGARVAGGATDFAVFAPGASAVEVELHAEAEGPPARTIPLVAQAGGVWRAEVREDLTGAYYRYIVAGGDPEFGERRQAVDPYARCNTRHDGLSLVMPERAPLPPGPQFPLEDAIIYELSLRDFTIDRESGVRARGKYGGLAEWGTSAHGVSTGLSHLAELGVNVIQLMPVFDFPNDEHDGAYDWGYMPAHFFCPEGWYATRTSGFDRVDELRALVEALHGRGFKVVFDVVYNHTGEAEPRQVLSLGALVPRYYYRYGPDGTPWNGSGCGNEFRSEAPWGRRLILDSLRHFVATYGADGFRFDLMPLIDGETLRRIAADLRSRKPDVLLYGEPWAAGPAGVPLLDRRALAQMGYGYFCDEFRDAARGGAFSREPGFLAAGVGVERLKAAIRGRDVPPLARILYLECHDNHTLWDRLELATRGAAMATPEDRKAMVKLGMALLLTSPGIPLIHAGQEFLRTKGGADNSYNLPDAVNMIRWRRKRMHRDVYEYVRGLVALRRAHGCLRIRTAAARESSIFFLDDDLGLPVPDQALAYLVRRDGRTDAFEELVVLANAGPAAQTFVLPGARWEVLADSLAAGPEPFRSLVGGEAVVPGRSAWVLGR